MLAAEARDLQIGDWVIANFGNNVKAAEITAIAWPTFTLSTTDYRGKEMIRTRTYRSLRKGKAPQSSIRMARTPFWLRLPEGKPS